MALTVLIRIFDTLSTWWEGSFTPRLLSSILIITFVFSLGATMVIEFSPLSAILSEHSGFNYFFAIENAFTILLIFEVLGLIFVLPKSVADSVGKQFEILSVILLRSAFKEFGHLSYPVLSHDFDYTELYPMLSDAFGALLIFFIIGFYYKKQRHESITTNKDEQEKFINFKKVVAMLLLLVYLFLGFMDLINLFTLGQYEASFNTFYTAVIFCDVLVLLYSLRYKTRYMNLFRYSSFAFATVLIRLSLSAPSYINALLGVLAGAFVLGLTLAYNHFRGTEVDSEF